MPSICRLFASKYVTTTTWSAAAIAASTIPTFSFEFKRDPAAVADSSLVESDDGVGLFGGGGGGGGGGDDGEVLPRGARA